MADSIPDSQKHLNALDYVARNGMGITPAPPDAVDPGLRDLITTPPPILDETAQAEKDQKITNLQNWIKGAGPHSQLGMFYRKQLALLQQPTNQPKYPGWDSGVPTEKHGFNIDWRSFGNWRKDHGRPPIDYRELFRDFQKYADVPPLEPGIKILLDEISAPPGTPEYTSELAGLVDYTARIRVESAATQNPLLALSLKIDRMINKGEPIITDWVADVQQRASKALDNLANYFGI